MTRLSENDLGAIGLYALEEVERLSSVLAGIVGAEKGLKFNCKVDKEQKDAIYIRKTGVDILIQGIDEASLLHGVYLCFEKLGFVFEFSGEIPPEQVDSNSQENFTLSCTPGVKRRGIRMHLNFVQDQSFFTEEEFAASIDNMAKLGFNYLVFHMYNPQEWYPFTYRGQEHLDLSLGNLNRAPLDEDMIGRDKVKVKEHWFPADLEEILDVAELRDAIYQRYKRMMARAKQRGIRIAISIEPESLSATFAEELKHWLPETGGEGDPLVNTWQQGWSGKSLAEIDTKNPVVFDIAVARCLAIVEAFPQLDELHLISREGTSYRLPSEAYNQEFSRIKERFHLPDSAWDFEVLSRIVPEAEGEVEVQAKVHQYWTVLPGDNHLATVLGALRFVEFARDIFMEDGLRARLESKGIESCITVYSPNPATIGYISPAVAQMIPDGCRIDYLGDYGAQEISDHLENWQPLLDKELSVGMISWLEFDGCMMLAQDWSQALYNNIQKAYKMGIETMYFNHWRIRSLEQSAQMAAKATLWPEKSKPELLEPYWRALYGKKALAEAESAFQALEKATLYSKRFNFNVGFTNDWVFYHSTDVPGYHWSLLLRSAQNYDQAAKAFKALAASACETGKKQAAYMAMLCYISARHIEAVYYLQLAKLPLYGFKAWPTSNPKASWPAPELLKLLEGYARKAYELEIEFMQTLAPWVESCDEQGQLAMHHQGVIQPFRDFYQTLKAKRQEGEDLERTLFN